MPQNTFQRLHIILHLFWRHQRYGHFLLWLAGAPLVYVFTRIAMRLDPIFFPALQHITVDRPVFIFGHPRSGTTFFQKRIAESGKVSVFRTWEIALPSLVQRRLLAPLVRLINRIGMRQLQSPQKGHVIYLNGVEEDEGLFLHRLDTEIMTILCPWLLTDEAYARAGLRLGWDDVNQQRRSVRFFKRCLKRQILHTGKSRVVAKFNPSLFRLKHLIQAFPDARLVYIVRTPRKSIPSFLSFHRRFVKSKLSRDEAQKYYRRKYLWSKRLYQYFEAVKKEIPPGQLLVLSFKSIKQDLKAALKRFYTFADLEPGTNYWQHIERLMSRSYQKKHRNLPTHEFGINGETIRDDLDFVWNQYLDD